MTNTIVYNRFSSTNPGEKGSTASGQPSYEIDLPNAGTSYVIGNVIQQPAANQNPTIVAYGEEGATNPDQHLYFVNNTVVNDFNGGTFLFVSGKVSTPALIQNNIFVGNGRLSSQASSVLKSNYRSFEADIGHATGGLRRFASALVIDAGTDPGKSASGMPLAPTGQYKDVASGEDRPVAGALDIGAYEVPGTTASAKSVTWTECAAESKVCRFSGTREVRFGSEGLYTSKIVTASTPCTVAAFGDPVHGVAKTCGYASVTVAAPAASPKAAAGNAWTPCAGEGAICQLSGTNRVRYGTETQNVTKVLTGPVTCSNATFGDPAHGSLKTCSFRLGR
jgi:hypothetical protein